MISRVTRSFWKAYEQLNAAQKTAARRAFALFLENPGHNSLQFKKLRGYPDYWSVRVSRDIGAVGKRTGDTIEWAWIGTHDEWSQREQCDMDGQPERASTREMASQFDKLFG